MGQTNALIQKANLILNGYINYLKKAKYSALKKMGTNSTSPKNNTTPNLSQMTN